YGDAERQLAWILVERPDDTRSKKFDALWIETALNLCACQVHQKHYELALATLRRVDAVGLAHELTPPHSTEYEYQYAAVLGRLGQFGDAALHAQRASLSEAQSGNEGSRKWITYRLCWA